MNFVTDASLMVAAASITTALIHLRLCFRPLRRRANILFVVTAAGVGWFALSERARMLADTPGEYIDLARWHQVPVWFLIVGIALFIPAFTRAGRPWLLWSIIICRTLALIANFVSTNNLTYRQITSMEHTDFLGETLHVAIGVASPWAILGQLSLVLLAVYALDASIELWRRGDRRHAWAVCGSIFFFSASAAVYAISVNWGFAHVPLFISPFFLAVIAAMGNELTLEVQRSDQLAVELAMRQADLAESEERLDQSASAAAIGIWTQAIPTGEFWASDRCHELYGFSNGDPMTYADVVARVDPADRHALETAINNAGAAGIPYDMEFRINLPDGSTRWIASRCTVESKNGKATLLRGADIDITERKLEQEARNNLAAIVESSEDAILSKTLDGIITSWNAGAAKMYGYAADEMIGKHVSVLAPEEKKDEISKILECIRNSEDVDHLETVRLSRDGRRIDVSLRVSPILDPYGKIIGASTIGRDITTRRLAEEALRDLSGKFMGAQEKERARLARELHDDLNQSLAHLSIQLEVLGRDPANPVALNKQIGKLTRQIKVLSSDVHRISHQLHPARLSKLGLGSALRGFCREYSASHGIKVDFTARDVPRTLPDDISLCLYRIAQESLQNVFKHSRAGTASVILEMEGSRIRLHVSDNGYGFDPEAVKSKDSLGLVSMAERVRALKGTISIDSTIGEGTHIVAEIPLPKE
jgi:PAS domain S-box-containing protein